MRGTKKNKKYYAGYLYLDSAPKSSCLLLRNKIVVHMAFYSINSVDSFCNFKKLV